MNPAAPSSTERRHEHRQRCLLAGTVTFRNRKTFYDCLIRNISDSGALVEFPDAFFPKEEFELHVRQQERSYRATVAWKKRRQSGTMLAAIAFGDPAPSLEGTRREQKLKRQNKSLRRRLDALA